MEYGILVLIPPVVIIGLALWSRKSFSSLMIGSIVAIIIMYGVSIEPIMDLVYGVVMDGDVQWTIMLTGTFGALIYLLQASRGIDAFTEVVSKFASNARRTMVAAWAVGIVVFIGDMLNIMSVGVTMKKLTDKYKVPREMLAYIMDSTAAPVAVLAPVSSWAAFFAIVMMGQPEIDFGTTSQVGAYVQIVPFLFYPMFTVLTVFLLSMGYLPLVGPMKKAFERAQSGGGVYSEYSKRFNEGEELSKEAQAVQDKNTPPRIINFALPILTLVFVAIFYGDVLVAGFIATLVLIILIFVQRIASYKEVCQIAMDGFTSMVPMLMIIVGAFMARDSLVAMGLPEYVITHLEPLMSPVFLAAITFLATATLSFVTSSSWGVPAVMVPIVIPLAAAVGAPLMLVAGAVVSAASFGSHACFYSDATVITSAIAKIENTEHAFSQFPYALFAAGCAFVAFVIAGFVMV